MSLNLFLPFLAAVALMLVNGWTDAPVNIATAIRSGAVRPKTAILLSAVCNFLGASAMCIFGSSVAVSIYSISGLTSVRENAAEALTAAVFAVVIWSLAALWFGLPTSESHALAAALTGAAVAVEDFKSVNLVEWGKTALGLLLSTLPVFLISFATAKFMQNSFCNLKVNFKKLQILGAMLSSFAHGAQDGQKFAGVLVLNLSLAAAQKGTVNIPLWATVLSAFFISLGTLLGGKKIIKKFGTLAPTDPCSGFCSDLVSAVTLLILSIFGVPASTTHAKSSAVMGAGTVNIPFKENLTTVKELITAWVLTFPVSAALSFFLTQVFINL
ncbi:MAG: inorganic phosphate transporter [Clostridia bacterium]|nr:inorganic phosphate transporter [Clostridia bacterium]